MVEDRVIDSNMNGFYDFYHHLFAVLVYYHNVGDACLGMKEHNSHVTSTVYRKQHFQ